MPIRYLSDGTAEEIDADGTVLQSWTQGAGTPALLGVDARVIEAPEPKKPAKKATSKKKG